MHEVMDLCFYYLYLPQLFLNSKYRELEQITYIVKEHYDWLKSSASLSTLKKHVIFFPNTVLACDGFWGTCVEITMIAQLYANEQRI